jgi:hypothetical protein
MDKPTTISVINAVAAVFQQLDQPALELNDEQVTVQSGE